MYLALSGAARAPRSPGNWTTSYVMSTVVPCRLVLAALSNPKIANHLVLVRRKPLLHLDAMFALGSSIAGGANSATTMIAGRTV